jgi:hypothetical protein
MPLSAAEAVKVNRATPAAKRNSVGTIIQGLQTVQDAEVIKTTALKSGIFDVATHDYAGAAVTWVLSAAEQLCPIVSVSNANGAVIATFGTKASCLGKVIIVKNTSGQALTVKPSDATGVVIASAKQAILFGDGADFIRVTADA